MIMKDKNNNQVKMIMTIILIPVLSPLIIFFIKLLWKYKTDICNILLTFTNDLDRYMKEQDLDHGLAPIPTRPNILRQYQIEDSYSLWDVYRNLYRNRYGVTTGGNNIPVAVPIKIHHRYDDLPVALPVPSAPQRL
jgi:hypothetical protein